MCRSHNMRIVFKVAEKAQQPGGKGRKETTAATSTAAATTTTTATPPPPPIVSTSEVFKYKSSENMKDLDNLVENGPFADNDDVENVDDDDEKQKKKKKRKRKRKQKKDKKVNKTDLDEEEEREAGNLEAGVQDEVLMNDNPPNQVRQMEPSLVEKLNNLMKHEASISAAFSHQPSLQLAALVVGVLAKLLRENF